MFSFPSPAPAWVQAHPLPRTLSFLAQGTVPKGELPPSVLHRHEFPPPGYRLLNQIPQTLINIWKNHLLPSVTVKHHIRLGAGFSIPRGLHGEVATLSLVKFQSPLFPFEQDCGGQNTHPCEITSQLESTQVLASHKK